MFASLSEGGQINNNMNQQHPYPVLSHIAPMYEQQQPGKELNKYASLKAVGKDHAGMASLQREREREEERERKREREREREGDRGIGRDRERGRERERERERERGREA